MTFLLWTCLSFSSLKISPPKVNFKNFFFCTKSNSMPFFRTIAIIKLLCTLGLTAFAARREEEKMLSAFSTHNCALRWYKTDCWVGLMSREKLKVFFGCMMRLQQKSCRFRWWYCGDGDCEHTSVKNLFQVNRAIEEINFDRFLAKRQRQRWSRKLTDFFLFPAAEVQRHVMSHNLKQTQSNSAREEKLLKSKAR